MHISIMKIKNHKLITILSFKFKKKKIYIYIYILGNIVIWVKHFLKYILILKKKKNAFIPLYSGFNNYVISKQMNSNKYYITTSFIPYNTYF